MEDLLLSYESEGKLSTYIKNSSQSVILTGNQWMDKNKVAIYLAYSLLNLSPESLKNYPHFHEIKSVDNKKIGIDEIRKINTYLSLVVPSNKKVSRVILINDANLMTAEAQNALLKNLEEPPEATIFILNAPSLSSLLPTITSRLSVVVLTPKNKEELKSWFGKQGYDQKSIETAINMSGGQPGLINLILADDDHPLTKATKNAKDMLQGNRLDRLSLINDLAKDKEELKYFFYILKEMARIGVKSPNSKSASQWLKILESSLKAESMLRANAQAKLTLTDFVLNVS